MVRSSSRVCSCRGSSHGDLLGEPVLVVQVDDDPVRLGVAGPGVVAVARRALAAALAPPPGAGGRGRGGEAGVRDNHEALRDD